MFVQAKELRKNLRPNESQTSHDPRPTCPGRSWFSWGHKKPFPSNTNQWQAHGEPSSTKKQHRLWWIFTYFWKFVNTVNSHLADTLLLQTPCYFGGPIIMDTYQYELKGQWKFIFLCTEKYSQTLLNGDRRSQYHAFFLKLTCLMWTPCWYRQSTVSLLMEFDRTENNFHD